MWKAFWYNFKWWLLRPSFFSAVIVVGSREPLWAALLPPARVTSTSCALVPRTVCSSRTGRCTATNTAILSVQRYGHNFHPKPFIIAIHLKGQRFILYVYPCTLYTCWFSLHCIDLWFVPFQMVSGKGFEVPRRVYVDFEGINLRRKFLTGLEPETINMTIGKDCRGVVCSWFEPLDCTEMKYACCISHSLYRPSFLSHVSRLSADSETWCVVRAVVKWEDAVPCRISVSDHCHTTGSVTDRVSMFVTWNPNTLQDRPWFFWELWCQL